MASENNIPSGSSMAEYRKIMKTAEDEIIQRGYDIGQYNESSIIIIAT